MSGAEIAPGGVRLLYALAIVNLVFLLGDVLYTVLGGLLSLVTVTGAR